jgi:hypothetical protein
VYGVIGRLRGAFEENFATSVLYHRGRVACSDLDRLVQGGNAGLAPALRREISRHAEACATCLDTRAELPSPTDIFAGFIEVAPDADLIDRVLAATPGAAAAVLQSAGDASLGSPPQLAFEETVAAALGGAQITDEAGGGRDGEEPAPEGEEETFEETEDEAEEIVAGQEDASFLPVREEGWQEGTSPAATQPPDEEQDEQEKALVPGRLAMTGTAATAVPSRPAGDPNRIRFSSDVVYGLPPPRRPWDRFAAIAGDGDRRRTMLLVVLGVLTLAFAYLGFVIGSSIEGGGDASDQIAALPTRAAGVREIACGTAPITLDQGSRATLTFDSQPLSGYQVSGVSVEGVSPNAVPRSVEARAQEGLSVLFEALPATGPAGRTDEYRLLVTFSRGEETTVSECRVLVKAPGTLASPSPTVATSPTATPTRTPPPAVQATSPPVIQPTPRPPTATVVPTRALCTPVPQPTQSVGGTPVIFPTPPFPTNTPAPVPCS